MPQSNSSVHKAAWTFVAALVGAWGAYGFQNSNEKVAVVDINAVADQCVIGKLNQGTIDNMNLVRVGFLQFLSSNRTIPQDQIKRLAVLWMKSKRTPAEEQELAKIKTDGITAGQRSSALIAKRSLTPEEQALLEEYARRSEATVQLGSQFQQSFIDEVEQESGRLKAELLQKCRVLAQAIGKKQGVTILFEAKAAPFAANDLTAETVEAVNAAK